MSSPKNKKAKMESFSVEQCQDAQEFASFYFDLLENHQNLFPYHLSDGALLDWFGRSVKGVQNIKEFIKSHMSRMEHKFAKIEPCHEIGYRKTHIVEYSQSRAAEPHLLPEEKSSAPLEKTPPNPPNASSSRKRETGQGDGLHNCSSESPTKRTRLTSDIEPKISTSISISHISTTGHLEFRAKSGKKYQKETKWQRPCEFQVAYSKTPTGYIVHLMIYKGNMRCRRNLLSDFNAVPNNDE